MRASHGFCSSPVPTLTACTVSTAKASGDIQLCFVNQSPASQRPTTVFAWVAAPQNDLHLLPAVLSSSASYLWRVHQCGLREGISRICGWIVSCGKACICIRRNLAGPIDHSSTVRCLYQQDSILCYNVPLHAATVRLSALRSVMYWAAKSVQCALSHLLVGGTLCIASHSGLMLWQLRNLQHSRLLVGQASCQMLRFVTVKFNLRCNVLQCNRLCCYQRLVNLLSQLFLQHDLNHVLHPICRGDDSRCMYGTVLHRFCARKYDCRLHNEATSEIGWCLALLKSHNDATHTTTQPTQRTAKH